MRQQNSKHFKVRKFLSHIGLNAFLLQLLLLSANSQKNYKLSAIYILNTNASWKHIIADKRRLWNRSSIICRRVNANVMTWAEMRGCKNGNERRTSDVEEKELSWLIEWNGLRCFFFLFYLNFHLTPVWAGEGRGRSEASPRPHKLQKCMSGQTKWSWKVVLNRGKVGQKGRLGPNLKGVKDGG